MQDNNIAYLPNKIEHILEILNKNNYEKIKEQGVSYLRVCNIASPNSVLDAIIKSILHFNKYNTEKNTSLKDIFGIKIKYKDYMSLQNEDKLNFLNTIRQKLKEFLNR